MNNTEEENDDVSNMHGTHKSKRGDTRSDKKHNQSSQHKKSTLIGGVGQTTKDDDQQYQTRNVIIFTGRAL